MARRKRQIRRPEEWENLLDEQLLRIRVRDLGLQIEGSVLQSRVEQLYAELDDRGIGFHPPCYLANEWLCPDRVPMIGVPFYLVHPRLKQLEQDMMLEVEGGTESSCMKLLRHEAGHAINYAYRLFARTRWRELFGPFSAPYSEWYYARPYSKLYVIHLGYNYAQAHPDEDFAETFAVCLHPGSGWQERYRDWPAMKKLHYVDHLMRTIGCRPPLVTTREELRPASRMTSTLAMHYDRKRRYLREGFPGFYDHGLQRLFVEGPPADRCQKASAFLRQWRRKIIDSVCMWTGDRKFDVNALLALLIRRCDGLGLYARKSEVETACDAAAFITAVMGGVHNFKEGAEGR